MPFGFTEQITQAMSIPVASIFPNNTASGNTNCGPIGVGATGATSKPFQRFMAHCMVGVLGTNANVTFSFQGSNTLTGTYTNIQNPNNNTNVVLTLSSNNTEGTVEVQAVQMATNNQYLQVVAIVNTNSSNIACTLFASCASYMPGSQYDYAAIGGNNATNTRLIT
jgi:hypothetical protein